MTQISDQICPFCDDNRNEVARDENAPLCQRRKCQRCGEYILNPYGLNEIKGFKENKHLVSGFIRHFYEKQQRVYPRETLRLDSDNIKAVITEASLYGVNEKAEKLLMATVVKSHTPGDVINFADEVDYPLAFSKDGKEFAYYRNHLINMEYLRIKLETPTAVIITPKGWNKVKEIEKSGKESKNCFVAMSFQKKFDFLYESIQKGVASANLGYAATKLNDPQDNEIIDNALIAKMRASRFMIADLSANNHGVYFEAGYMKALGRPVIFTCRRLLHNKTLEDAPRQRLHFDVEHHPIIFWDEANLSDFENALRDWIIAWCI